jgi:UDP-N-acetylglucosamine 2-epimerase (non-hydrolysing)
LNRLRPLLIVGTRPEAIKMSPVIKECRDRPREIDAIVCSTGQHREMLQQVADYFEIKIDLDLGLMRPNQTLAGLTARCLTGLEDAINKYNPDCVVAQGDTTTVMAASLAAFYHRIPFVHVEAGLRTGDLHAPWPEEMNRRVAGIVADLHCAPTQRAADALLSEGTRPDIVQVSGNTVIDALLWTVARERNNSEQWEEKYAFLQDRRMVLITGHRRENFGGGFENICQAISTLAADFPETDFVYPVHLNPNVQAPVKNVLGALSNVHLVAPAPYPEFVWLMDRSSVILTDSGGVQEEAPSLKKPVLVMRDTTERPEAVESGAVELVGTSIEAITQGVSTLLSDAAEYSKRQIDDNPYGDGRAARRIVDGMLAMSWQSTQTLRRAG